MSGPLSGLIVADFSRVLAGPYASMLLGDLGADVIKVERPGTGDDTRAWGPPWRDGESTYYLSLNRNKRSVVLDLTDEGDRALARTLGERADVLIESFRPGLMASWGLDGDTLRAVNPRLVSCSVTAFGSGEAAAGMPGYDFLLQAMGGLMSVTGEPDGRPLKAGAAVVDLICGLLATIGIQAALARRRRPPRRGVADGRCAGVAAQPGVGVGGRRRGAEPARQPPPEHRPVRDLRGVRPAVRGRGRQRPPVRAAVRGGRAPRARGRRALRDQRGARRARRRSSRPRSTPSSAPSPPTTGSRGCARPRSPSARSTPSTRRSRSPPTSASSPPTTPSGCRSSRRRYGSTARGRRSAIRRRRSTSTATRSAAGSRAEQPFPNS